MDDQDMGFYPIEPTTPVSRHLYEHTAPAPYPYEDVIPIPPPPPRQRKTHRILGVLLVIAAALSYWTYTYHVSTIQPTPIVRFVPVTPTAPLPTPTPVVTITPTASPNTVYISDAAHVFGDQSQVKSDAATLPNPISIYTTSTFNGTNQEFDQQARSHVISSNMIVMAIDTTHRHLAIMGGSNVPLSNSQYQDAVQSFKSNFNGGDYTGATIAAIRTLHNDLGANPAQILALWQTACTSFVVPLSKSIRTGAVSYSTLLTRLSMGRL